MYDIYTIDAIYIIKMELKYLYFSFPSDDYVTRMNLLREKNDKECKQHVLEMKEFSRILHHDEKLHGFMALKNKERQLMESHAQRMERKNLFKLHQMDRVLASYQQSLREILKVSEFDSMHRLVASYNGQEQANFALFRTITDLNNEVS